MLSCLWNLNTNKGVVIEHIIGLYQNEHQVGKSNVPEIFKLLEKAQIIQRAENETEFQSAIVDL